MKMYVIFLVISFLFVAHGGEKVKKFEGVDVILVKGDVLKSSYDLSGGEMEDDGKKYALSCKMSVDENLSKNKISIEVWESKGSGIVSSERPQSRIALVFFGENKKNVKRLDKVEGLKDIWAICIKGELYLYFKGEYRFRPEGVDIYRVDLNSGVVSYKAAFYDKEACSMPN